MRELFRRYRHNRMLLQRRLRELESMGELTDTVRGSSAEYPYTAQVVTVRGRNAAEERRVRQQIAALQADCTQVERAMERAPNSSVRLMLELRYLDGLSWEETAEAMGGGVSGDALRKRAADFFAGLKVGSENSGFSVSDVL